MRQTNPPESGRYMSRKEIEWKSSQRPKKNFVRSSDILKNYCSRHNIYNKGSLGAKYTEGLTQYFCTVLQLTTHQNVCFQMTKSYPSATVAFMSSLSFSSSWLKALPACSYHLYPVIQWVWRVLLDNKIMCHKLRCFFQLISLREKDLAQSVFILTSSIQQKKGINPLPLPLPLLQFLASRPEWQKSWTPLPGFILCPPTTPRPPAPAFSVPAAFFRPRSALSSAFSPSLTFTSTFG